jgi:EF hand domain-containing protein
MAEISKRSVVLGALVALLPALSAAQPDRFRAIDRNGDGLISSEEWYRQGGAAPVPFTVVDLNGDGRISESEFRDWGSARGGAGVMGVTTADRFRAIDKNKDGVISADEWKSGWLSLNPFESVDANKDGRISRGEFSAWDQRRGGPAVATHGAPPGTNAPAMSERMRTLDHGAAGVSGPAGVAGSPGVQPSPPPTPSSLTPAPQSPTTSTPSTSQIPGASSPNMSSGSSFNTK